MSETYDRNEHVLDPAFELLWKKIAEAYKLVANNAERVIEFEHEKYAVMVERGDVATMGEAGPNTIVIYIEDNVEVKPPTLVVP